MDATTISYVVDEDLSLAKRKHNDVQKRILKIIKEGEDKKTSANEIYIEVTKYLDEYYDAADDYETKLKINETHFKNTHRDYVENHARHMELILNHKAIELPEMIQRLQVYMVEQKFQTLKLNRLLTSSNRVVVNSKYDILELQGRIDAMETYLERERKRRFLMELRDMLENLQIHFCALAGPKYDGKKTLGDVIGYFYSSNGRTTKEETKQFESSVKNLFRLQSCEDVQRKLKTMNSNFLSILLNYNGVHTPDSLDFDFLKESLVQFNEVNHAGVKWNLSNLNVKHWWRNVVIVAEQVFKPTVVEVEFEDDGSDIFRF